MERLTFKQFIKEAVGIFGRYGTKSAIDQDYAKRGTRYNSPDVRERELMQRFYSGDPQAQEKVNLRQIGTTIPKEKAEGDVPRTRDYEAIIAQNRAAASIPFTRKLEESRFPFSKKIRVFDFDNTIANTNSSVLIKHRKTGEQIARLTSAEFARYRPQPHEVPDFSEFGKVINPVAIPQIQRIMGNLASKRRPYMVLTARPQSSSKDILKYLKAQGLHTRGVKIIGLGTSDPTAKAKHLQKMLSSGRYTHLEFFDDHHENVKHVAGLAKMFPDINIRARHIAYGDKIK